MALGKMRVFGRSFILTIVPSIIPVIASVCRHAVLLSVTFLDAVLLSVTFLDALASLRSTDPRSTDQTDQTQIVKITTESISENQLISFESSI